MKIIIYSRVSNSDNKKSIDNQIKLARQWINNSIKNEKHIEKDVDMNIDIEEIVDEGYSGSNMNRPGIQTIIEYVNKVKNVNEKVENENVKTNINRTHNLKAIDIIVVKDISRLGRNYIEVGNLVNDIQEAGIKLICINQEKDDMFCVDIDSIMADFYSKDISIKTKSVLDMSKRKGKYSIGKVPYGYRKNKEDKYLIEIYEPEAKIVRFIYSQYNEGKKIEEIVRILNKRGLKNKDLKNIDIARADIENDITSKNSINIESKCYTEWNYNKVYRILHNEFYKGTMVYNKSIGHIWEGKKRKYIHKDNWERIEKHHPAII